MIDGQQEIFLRKMKKAKRAGKFMRGAGRRLGEGVVRAQEDVVGSSRVWRVAGVFLQRGPRV